MFHELIYCEEDQEDYNKLQALIRSSFPGAKIEGGYDEIKGWRIQIEGEGPQDDFYRFAIKHRFAMQGLSFQLDLRMHTPRIKALVDECLTS